MRALLLAAVVLVGCGSAREARLGPPTAEAPAAALDLLVELHDGQGGRGWGTPVASGQILTASHVSESAEVLWRGQGRVGKAEPMWAQVKKDLALLRADGAETLTRVPIAPVVPGQQEVVWWKHYLKGGVPAIARGRVLGIDGDKDLLLSGASWPGASGSGVLDGQGRLVAVILAAWNPAVDRKADLETRFWQASNFPPVFIARVVAGGSWR